ncbi:lysoplasmalogenase [Chitinophaga pendula]|uniref:lysoplasmalogenase n=1 Tax=Chitinophaga TaxID=79328 RepID=UPI000BAEFCAD|nr:MULTISPECIES: lysoplasmalogenase [Chitinophaga]ASZ10572.1 lysoplasmalogenase [Chitinophaga sp. MD30]UCJ06454.1 lysoplasmalogenase [Chitinophaga pendula]
MHKNWHLLYFTILALHLGAITLQYPTLQLATKPLLVLTLIIYSLKALTNTPPVFKTLLIAALCCSWAGDILLMFDARQEVFFMAGLGSFLLSHLCYISLFLKIRYTNPPLVLCRWPFIFLTEACVLAFIFFLLPHLGPLLVPVIIYAITISFTLLCAMHAFHFNTQPRTWRILIGAIVFIISDALLATNKFYQPLPAAQWWVMLTYGLAQWGIVSGSVAYLDTRRHNALATR